VTRGFIIEPLAAHDRSGFSCGTPSLDRYFREQASQDVKRRLMASCFIAIDATTRDLAGYYTLAATSVPAPSCRRRSSSDCRAIRSCPAR
jgi:hypothetical protein